MFLLKRTKAYKFQNRIILYFAIHKIGFIFKKNNIIVDHQMAPIFLKIQQKQWKFYSKYRNIDLKGMKLKTAR